jgi:hypothetical protein
LCQEERQWPKCDRARHKGCGGRAGKVELLTGIDGVSRRPVQRTVLRDG